VAVTLVPTVRLMNPKTGDVLIYNAEDILRNPRLADGLEIVAHHGGADPVVSLPDTIFATSDEYINAARDEKPLEASSEASEGDAKKKRGRPAKGV
jgi:hypothetical protein